MSRQVGGGRWTASPGVDSPGGKFSTRMRSCRTCVQTLMIMSGQLGPGRVDSGRCHEWTVRQLLQVGGGALSRSGSTSPLRTRAPAAMKHRLRLADTDTDTDRVPSHTPGRDRRDDQHWRNPSRTFSRSAYESPARCWRPYVRLERARRAPEESSNSALGAWGSGSSPVTARRIQGSFPVAAVSGAEAGARGGLTSAAD